MSFSQGNTDSTIQTLANSTTVQGITKLGLTSVSYEPATTRAHTLSVVPESSSIILAEDSDALVQLTLPAMIHLVRTATRRLIIAVYVAGTIVFAIPPFTGCTTMGTGHSCRANTVFNTPWPNNTLPRTAIKVLAITAIWSNKWGLTLTSQLGRPCVIFASAVIAFRFTLFSINFTYVTVVTPFTNAE
jgi:hypothetical protein